MKHLLVLVIAGCGAPPSPPPTQPTTVAPTGSATQPLAPEPPATPAPDNVGTANMDAAGIVYLRLRSVDHGMVAEAMKVVKPTDSDYADIVKHLGGIKPGESKPIPPFPEP
jgi:hypothetical protein